MSFLLLAQGDPVGKDLLKKLVVGRYGFNPPALETLRVQYKGRSRGRLGPFPVWARLAATVSYRFPLMMKWEIKVSVLGIFKSSFTTSFDGQAVYEEQGIHITKVTEPLLVESGRRRAWSETVFFVSPLIADRDVVLKGVDAHTFLAHVPGCPDDCVTVRLNDDHTLREIEVERVDPQDNSRKLQYIRPQGSLVRVDGLLMPPIVQRYWGDELFMELEPLAVEMNPDLPADAFVLRNEDDAPTPANDAADAAA